MIQPVGVFHSSNNKTANEMSVNCRSLGGGGGGGRSTREEYRLMIQVSFFPTSFFCQSQQHADVNRRCCGRVNGK